MSITHHLQSARAAVLALVLVAPVIAFTVSAGNSSAASAAFKGGAPVVAQTNDMSWQ
ncbi:hypothetical protein ACK8N7_25065 [Streptomyces griseobrunneus]|uniref:hypothetical protein n=1 Tax=Streptomyces microflavus TaxID=1919 RepID=UPI00381E410F